MVSVRSFMNCSVTCYNIILLNYVLGVMIYSTLLSSSADIGKVVWLVCNQPILAIAGSNVPGLYKQGRT